MLNYLVALHAVTRGIDVKFVSTPTLFIIARTRNLTKENGLMVLIDNSNGKIVNHKYCIRENYEYARSIFEESKSCGIMPMAITVDGNTSVMRAIKDVWPDIIIQRCLAHIQRQGLSWLRRNPKLEASKKLRDILLSVTKIKNERGKK